MKAPGSDEYTLVHEIDSEDPTTLHYTQLNVEPGYYEFKLRSRNTVSSSAWSTPLTLTVADRVSPT